AAPAAECGHHLALGVNQPGSATGESDNPESALALREHRRRIKRAEIAGLAAARQLYCPGEEVATAAEEGVDLRRERPGIVAFPAREIELRLRRSRTLHAGKIGAETSVRLDDESAPQVARPRMRMCQRRGARELPL